MLVLKEFETCPYGNRCPYASDPAVVRCQGLNPQRKVRFHCTYVKEDGSIGGGNLRNPYDKTGKMKLIVD